MWGAWLEAELTCCQRLPGAGAASPPSSTREHLEGLGRGAGALGSHGCLSSPSLAPGNRINLFFSVCHGVNTGWGHWCERCCPGGKVSMIGAKDPVTLSVQNLSTPSQASAQIRAGTAGTGLTPGTKVAILRLRQSEGQGAA